MYADPAYQYLLNGLAITIGPGPGHTDHPGTSLQLLSGLLTLVSHMLIRDGSGVVASVVQNPEVFALISAITLILGQGIALFWTSIRIYRVSNLGSTALFQAIVLCAGVLFAFRVYLIPEGLVIICAILVIGFIAPALLGMNDRIDNKTAIILGIVLAVGITAKVIFIPMLILPLILFKWRQIIVTYVSMIASVAVIMFFARDQISRSIEWFTQVSTTSARYPDEVRPDSFFANFVNIPSALLEWYPVYLFMAFLSLLILIFVVTQRKSLAFPLRGVLALLSASIIALLMAYKAFRPNDLFVLVPISGAIAALLWSWASVRVAFLARSTTQLGITTLAVLLAITLNVTDTNLKVSEADTNFAENDISALLDSYIAREAYVAVGYAVFTKESALYYANTTSRNIALPEIVKQYPGWLDFNIWNSMFYTFSAEGNRLATCEELRSIVDSEGGLIFVPGRELDLSVPTMQYASLVLLPEAIQGRYVIYRVASATC
jgi:hypothetical protein